jgi:hypothetical protein
MLSDSTASERSIESDSHRHHDRKKLPRSNGLHHRRIQLSAEAELDLVFVKGRENVEKISRIEAYRHVCPGILDRHFVETFAAFGGFGRDAKRALGKSQLHPACSFAGRHGDGSQGFREGRPGHATSFSLCCGMTCP